MNVRDYEAGDRPALEELTLRAWKPVFAGLERSNKPEIYVVFVPDWQAEQMRSLNTVCDSGNVHAIVAERDEKILGFAARETNEKMDFDLYPVARCLNRV